MTLLEKFFYSAIGLFCLVAAVLVIRLGIKVSSWTPEEEFYQHYVLRDPETGCEYIRGRALTPRVDGDGKHICRKRP